MPDQEMLAIRAELAANPRPPDLGTRRQRLDALGGQAPVPAQVRIEPVRANGVPAEWSLAPKSDGTRVLLFLHGGGYVSGSLDSHRAHGGGSRAGWRGCAHARARLPPGAGARLPGGARGTRLPATATCSRSGSIRVASRSVAIARAADSPIATLVSLQDAGLPLPACGWCVSPWVDLDMTGDSIIGKAEVNPMIQKNYLARVGGCVSAQRPMPRSSLACHRLYADLSGPVRRRC